MFSTGETSFYSWLAARVTFVYLLLFGVAHLYFFALTPEASLVSITERLTESTVWRAVYVLFVPAVVGHFLNGLYCAFQDYEPPRTIAILTKYLFFLIGFVAVVVGEWTLFTMP